MSKDILRQCVTLTPLYPNPMPWYTAQEAVQALWDKKLSLHAVAQIIKELHKEEPERFKLLGICLTSIALYQKNWWHWKENK